MHSSDDIVRLAETYSRATGLSVATVATYMGGSGDTVRRLKQGRDLTTSRAARFGRWFSEHWPPGQPWPEGVWRPEPVSAARRDTS